MPGYVYIIGDRESQKIGHTEECIGVAQKMFQLRKIIAHTCAVCGIEFQALKTAKFCSNRCRQAAKYQRVRAAKGEKK